MPARVRPRPTQAGEGTAAVTAGETEIDDNGRPESAARDGPRFLYRPRRRRHERFNQQDRLSVDRGRCRADQK